MASWRPMFPTVTPPEKNMHGSQERTYKKSGDVYLKEQKRKTNCIKYHFDKAEKAWLCCSLTDLDLLCQAQFSLKLNMLLYNSQLTRPQLIRNRKENLSPRQY